MAEIRQGYLDDYTQITSGNIGIGTSISNEKLEIIGGTTSQELSVTGIATLSSFSGFIKKHTEYNEDVDFDAGDSGTLSGEIIVGVGLTMTVGTGATASQGTVESLKVSTMFQPPSGGTNQRPPGKPGALFYNFDFKTIEFFDGNSWRQVDNIITRGRSVHAGGADPSNSYLPTMSYFDHVTSGIGLVFGDLTVGGQGLGGFSSSTRGLFSGRRTPSTNPDNIIDYITMASAGNAIDFGDMTNQRRLGATLSSSTRGIMAGGITPTRVNTIDYVEMSTIGNAIDFGDTTELFASSNGGGISNGTRGVYNSGQDGSSNVSSNIQFITISSKGNAVKFGELNVKRRACGMCSNSTRGLFAAGYNGGSSTNTIEFITIASTGNGTDFGELNRPKTTYAQGSASQTRGFFSGGSDTDNPYSSAISVISIAQGGSATDFGDLAVASESSGACSDSHGGLGGY